MSSDYVDLSMARSVLRELERYWREHGDVTIVAAGDACVLMLDDGKYVFRGVDLKTCVIAAGRFFAEQGIS